MNAAAQDGAPQDWESLARSDPPCDWDVFNRAARAQRRRRTAAVKLTALAIWIAASAALANRWPTSSNAAANLLGAAVFILGLVVIGAVALLFIGWVIYQILLVLGVVE